MVVVVVVVVEMTRCFNWLTALDLDQSRLPAVAVIRRVRTVTPTYFRGCLEWHLYGLLKSFDIIRGEIIFNTLKEKVQRRTSGFRHQKTLIHMQRYLYSTELHPL